jgi:hypothetical protein
MYTPAEKSDGLNVCESAILLKFVAHMYHIPVVAVPPHILERQRHRRPHSPSDPPYRRMPTDMRSARKPSVPNVTPRPPPRSRRSSMPGPERNMLQRELLFKFLCDIAYTFVCSTSDAWHTVMTTDPLVDSDEECHDGHVRTDYSTSISFHLHNAP